MRGHRFVRRIVQAAVLTLLAAPALVLFGWAMWQPTIAASTGAGPAASQAAAPSGRDDPAAAGTPAAPAAPAPAHPGAIIAISVCSPAGKGGAGSCPPGTFDTTLGVVSPGSTSGNINGYQDIRGISDEHASVFAPGTLAGNPDYLFFVAGTTHWNQDENVGLVVLSGKGGPDNSDRWSPSGQWTFDFPTAEPYGHFADLVTPTPQYPPYGQIFLAPTKFRNCPVVPSGTPAAQDQTFDLNYAAPGSIVRDTSAGPGRLLMIYEGTNKCPGIGSAGGSTPNSGGAYISVGVAASTDYGFTWPTYRGAPAFAFTAVPQNNASQGPGQPPGALWPGVCIGNNCALPGPQTPGPPADYGRYVVISPPTPLAAIMATATPLAAKVGDGEPSAFVDDASGSVPPYLYVVHDGPVKQTMPAPRNDSDLTVARAQLNGGTAPLEFDMWDGTSFRGSALNGNPAALFQDPQYNAYQACGAAGQNRTAGSISYVEDTQQYLLTFVCVSPTDPDPAATPAPGPGAAWFWATAADLSAERWSVPQEIKGSWSAWDEPTPPAANYNCSYYRGWYPTFMSLDKPPSHLSTRGYVFYMHGCLGGANSGNGTTPPERQYESRAFTIMIGTYLPLLVNLAQ